MMGSINASLIDYDLTLEPYTETQYTFTHWPECASRAKKEIGVVQFENINENVSTYYCHSLKMLLNIILLH